MKQFLLAVALGTLIGWLVGVIFDNPFQSVAASMLVAASVILWPRK